MKILNLTPLLGADTRESTKFSIRYSMCGTYVAFFCVDKKNQTVLNSFTNLHLFRSGDANPSLIIQTRKYTAYQTLHTIAHSRFVRIFKIVRQVGKSKLTDVKKTCSILNFKPISRLKVKPHRLHLYIEFHAVNFTLKMVSFPTWKLHT